jgi:hypothetical protein
MSIRNQLLINLAKLTLLSAVPIAGAAIADTHLKRAWPSLQYSSKERDIYLSGKTKEWLYEEIHINRHHSFAIREIREMAVLFGGLAILGSYVSRFLHPRLNLCLHWVIGAVLGVVPPWVYLAMTGRHDEIQWAAVLSVSVVVSSFFAFTLALEVFTHLMIKLGCHLDRDRQVIAVPSMDARAITAGESAASGKLQVS